MIKSTRGHFCTSEFCGDILISYHQPLLSLGFEHTKNAEDLGRAIEVWEMPLRSSLSTHDAVLL